MTLSNKPGPQFRQRPRPSTTPITADHVTATAPAPVVQPRQYEVGYGKPPPGNRFKPGQSGNPKGRPKGARGLKTMVRELLCAPTEVRIGNRLRRVPRIQALLMKQLEKAGKGDHRSLEQLIRMYQAAVPEPIDAGQGVVAADDPMTPGDEAILEQYRLLILAESADQEDAA